MPVITLEDQGFFRPFELLAQGAKSFREQRRAKRDEDRADRELGMRDALLKQQLERDERLANFHPQPPQSGQGFTWFQTSPGQWDFRPTPQVEQPDVSKIEQVPVPGGDPIYAKVKRDAAGNVLDIVPVPATRTNANKPMGDEALNKFNAAAFALDQLPDLAEVTKSAGDEGGPFAGRVRRMFNWMVGPSQSDLEFSNLSARMLAPIAKGVLGETGVLSDQDIARIAPLLPQYTDTKDQRRFKMEKLQEVLGRQVSRQMDVMQSAGRDTSGLKVQMAPRIEDATGGPSGSAGNPVPVSTQEEFDALPSGTYFRDAEGVKLKP